MDSDGDGIGDDCDDDDDNDGRCNVLLYSQMALPY